MTGRRELVLAVVLVLAGAALVLLASSRTWVSAAWVVPGFPAVRVQVAGAEAAPVVRATGLVALAGVVALLATRRRARAVVGAVVVLAAAALVTASVLFWSGQRAVAEAALERAGGSSGRGAEVAELATTAWPAVALVGGLLVAAGGVLTVARSGRWPAMGARYDAPTAARKARTSEDPWAALDRGEDPTTRQ